jgi:hypothetical protein
MSKMTALLPASTSKMKKSIVTPATNVAMPAFCVSEIILSMPKKECSSEVSCWFPGVVVREAGATS